MITPGTGQIPSEFFLGQWSLAVARGLGFAHSGSSCSLGILDAPVSVRADACLSICIGDQNIDRLAFQQFWTVV